MINIIIIIIIIIIISLRRTTGSPGVRVPWPLLSGRGRDIGLALTLCLWAPPTGALRSTHTQGLSRLAAVSCLMTGPG